MAARIKSSPFLFFFLVTAAVYLPAFFFAYQQRFINPLFVSPFGFPVEVDDSRGYAALADNMVSRGVFSWFEEGVRTPNTVRTPAYPAFIAALRYPFGSFIAVSFAQMVLAALTAVLMFAIGRRVGLGYLAWLPPLGYLLDPMTIHSAIAVMSEILFVFLFTLAVYIFFFGTKEDSYRQMILAGVVMGLAILTRPIGVYAAYLFGAFYIIFRARSLGAVKALKLIAVFAATIFLVLAPWLMRNKRVSGIFALSSAGIQNFVMWDLGLYLSAKRDLPRTEVYRTLHEEAGLDGQQIFDLAHAPELTRVAIRYLRDDPFGYAKFHMLKTAPFFFGSSLRRFVDDFRIGASVLPKDRPNLSLLFAQGNIKEFLRGAIAQGIFTIERIGWLLVCACAAFAAIRFRKAGLRPAEAGYGTAKAGPHVLLFSAVVLMFALLTGPVSSPKYRLQVEPFLLILAAEGLAVVISARQSPHRPFLTASPAHDKSFSV